MNAQHTPGPFEAEDRTAKGAGFAIVAPNEHYSRAVLASYVSERDASLFAAAPDLLAALKRLASAVATTEVSGALLVHVPAGWANVGDALAETEAAIAKAEAQQ